MRHTKNSHWVEGPEDKSETTNGSKESGGLVILLLSGLATIESNLVDNDQVGETGHGIPSPLGRLLDLEGSKETSEDHDDVSNDGNKNAGTIQAGQEAEIEKQEWCGDAPVNISSPVDLTVDGIIGIWEVLLCMLDQDLVLTNTITDCHGKVGKGGKGGDEGSQDVEQPFLLWTVS